MFERHIVVGRRCRSCGLDYAIFDPGDGPAVFGILIVGAIVAGLALWVEFTWSPPVWLHLVLWIPLICLLTLGILRLTKSALLVLQYKHRAGEGRLS